jgi:hypothetical protein
MPVRKPSTAVINESRQWLASAVLNAAVLEPLHELNRRWLALLTRTPRLWAARATGSRLPDPVGSSLLAITPEQCVEIARCPFSLFTASFNDGVYWRAVAGNSAVREPPAAESDQRGRDELMSFAQLALFYAWHLARVNPAAARIVLGMPDQTLAAFELLGLSTLQNLAMTSPELIMPRWPERPTFWLRLLDPSSEKAPPSEVRSLGLQMLAAELMPDQARNLNARRTTRP